MPGTFLANIQWDQRHPEYCHSSDDVRNESIGDQFESSLDQRIVYDLQRTHQFLRLDDRLNVLPAFERPERVLRRGEVYVIVQVMQPRLAILHRAHEALAQVADDATVLLPLVVRLPNVPREGLQFLREPAGDCKVRVQDVQVVQEQLGGAQPLVRHDLEGDLRRAVGIAVAVAADPARELDRRALHRELLPEGNPTLGVELAEVGRHGVP